MKNFKELEVWKKGFQIASNVFSITKFLPNDLKFSLGSQLNAAAISIPSNIAEGSSRSSDKDYNRFIEIALGSCFEVETQLMIAQNLIDVHQCLIKQTLDLIVEEEKMLTSFSSRLKLKAKS